MPRPKAFTQLTTAPLPLWQQIRNVRMPLYPSTTRCPCCREPTPRVGARCEACLQCTARHDQCRKPTLADDTVLPDSALYGGASGLTDYWAAIHRTLPEPRAVGVWQFVRTAGQADYVWGGQPQGEFTDPFQVRLQLALLSGGRVLLTTKICPTDEQIPSAQLRWGWHTEVVDLAAVPASVSVATAHTPDPVLDLVAAMGLAESDWTWGLRYFEMQPREKNSKLYFPSVMRYYAGGGQLYALPDVMRTEPAFLIQQVAGLRHHLGLLPRNLRPDLDERAVARVHEELSFQRGWLRAITNAASMAADLHQVRLSRMEPIERTVQTKLHEALADYLALAQVDMRRTVTEMLI